MQRIFSKILNDFVQQCFIFNGLFCSVIEGIEQIVHQLKTLLKRQRIKKMFSVSQSNGHNLLQFWWTACKILISIFSQPLRLLYPKSIWDIWLFEKTRTIYIILPIFCVSVRHSIDSAPGRDTELRLISLEPASPEPKKYLFRSFKKIEHKL